MIQIRKQAISQMLAHARMDAPIEACGYLAEKDGIVVSIFPMKNVDFSPVHFSFDVTEQFATARLIRAQGLKLRGIYHSHPTSPAMPSQEDLRLSFDPELSYVIISLLAQKGDVKSFVIKNKENEEETVEIIDGETK